MNTLPRQGLLDGLCRSSTGPQARSAPKEQNRRVTMTLFDGRSIEFVGRSTARDLHRGNWFGDIVSISNAPTEPPLGSVVLTLTNEGILGTIVLADGVYQLLPLDNGRTALVLFDASTTTPDDPPPTAEMLRAPMPY